MPRHHCTQIVLVSLSYQPLWNCTTLKWEMDGLMQRKMLPTGNTLLESTHAAKSLIKSFGLDYEMIHACHNDCILYWCKCEK